MIKKILAMLSFLAVIFFVLELGTFGLHAVSFKLGLTQGASYLKYKSAFHPLFTGKRITKGTKSHQLLYWSEYDPWYAWRVNKNASMGVFVADQMGFISNGIPERDISTKSSDVYRIFIIGGSAAAGQGATSADKTIAAQLEKKLNAINGSLGDIKFEVINASVPGYFSSIELAYLAFELVYLKPDLVIAFNGANDFYQILNKILKKTRPPYYHWSKRHFYFKKYLEAQIPQLIIPERWQLWNYSYFCQSLRTAGLKIVNYFNDDYNDKKIFLKKQFPLVDDIEINKGIRYLSQSTISHGFGQTNTIDVEVSEHDLSYFKKNMTMMKSICVLEGADFIHVLQPALHPNFKLNMSPEEQMMYQLKLEQSAQALQIDYTKVYAQFNDFAKKEFSSLFNNKETQEFYNFSDIFLDVESGVYIDTLHYSNKGQELIAERLKSIIENLLYSKPEF